MTDVNQNARRRYYGKDRVAGNGKTLPLETIIKTQTMDAARIFGLEDRGVLAAGMRADLNIIDMEKLKVRTTIKQ
jgi:N-acyl-D-aspartate/D-glutamate deacylase